jgi:6-pyruvoyltetrahydropterin/6-carboxytetrahydropterin synthase
MMFEVTESFGFMATHRLPDVARNHPCARIHVHRWSVSVVLRAGRLPSSARSSELAAVEPLRRFLIDTLDGKYLNDLLTEEPTAGRVADYIAGWCEGNLDGYIRAVLHSITVAIMPAPAGTGATVLFTRRHDAR